MTTMNQQVTCLCGPYKGYLGKAHYNFEDKEYYGTVQGTRDIITFVGATPETLSKEFQESVNDYLEMCASRGEKPEKPFSGKFLARIPPELHRRISVVADLHGISLNQLVSDSIEKFVGADSPVPVKPGGRQPRGNRNGAKARSKAKPRKRKPSRS